MNPVSQLLLYHTITIDSFHSKHVEMKLPVKTGVVNSYLPGDC